MRDNPIQFAVVREDPEIEASLVRSIPNPRSVYLIGSGGCTALNLAAQFPDLEITLVDPNSAQLDLVRRKAEFVVKTKNADWKKQFGIGSEDPKSVVACGNFESLFRGFREFLYEFVADRATWQKMGTNAVDFPSQIFKAKYWPVAFDLYFSDSLLLAMFGPDAIQCAEPGSYPKYFRRQLEAGLLRGDARTNYFLHHLFLGHYIDDKNSLPHYLTHTFTKSPEFTYCQAIAQEGPHFGAFDLVNLSNIFDWMDPSQATRLIRRVSEELRPGAWVIYRELNSSFGRRELFGADFTFDDERARTEHARDRSLFYSRLHLGQKTKGGK